MTSMSKKSTKLFAQKILERLRGFIVSENLNIDRLPKWVKSANVKIARLNNSIVFLFEESFSDEDEFIDCGKVKSDIQFLLDLPEFIPKAACFRAPEKPNGGLIILQGEYDEDKKVVFKIVSDRSALFNVGYVNHHNPLAIINIFIQLISSHEVLSTRFVPFAIFVHANDFSNFESFWNKCTPHIQDSLKLIHDSEAGDFYQFQAERKKVFQISKEKSVIVLGKYSNHEMNELFQVRDYLRAKGYDAHLIIELPEYPMMSNEEKVRVWTTASRFCVMIDREAAGHIAEYQYLKNQRTILALLRPKGRGSTYMIGDEHLTDFRYINLFEFEKSPLEVIDIAIDWAEKLVRKRMKNYEAAYPWRRKRK